uniref:Uncharacterized protein n=1 Tax=mine drainage metagenome TaxID=410659 RepID=E6PSP3_9ZZZZ
MAVPGTVMSIFWTYNVGTKNGHAPLLASAGEPRPCPGCAGACLQWVRGGVHGVGAACVRRPAVGLAAVDSVMHRQGDAFGPRCCGFAPSPDGSQPFGAASLSQGIGVSAADNTKSKAMPGCARHPRRRPAAPG